MRKNKSSGFGTLPGVFTPTIVTILGVIMYLRQGWLVGNAGLLGAWLIILLCVSITATTALSLSSIATNTRLHAGGAYAIISRSLGKETGASIGIVLYLAQSMAIVMYIFGFREGWLSLFPSHDPLFVDLLCFTGIFTIAKMSTKLAFWLQFAVIAITTSSIVSVSWSPFQSSQSIQWVGSFQGDGYQGFWMCLAVYFPGVTGILAGSNLSGELKDPRSSIPRGTLMAVAISTLVYLWLAYVYASSASTEDLLNNYNVMASISAIPGFIPFAIICATFCSALATLVGAPRILHALASDGLVPRSKTLSVTNAKREPSNAILITGSLVFLLLFLRDLNVIAPLITICFLTTYGMINLVVLIEQKLGLLSFRPTIKIPPWIPTYGAIGCFLTMMIINPTLSLLSILIIVFGYISLGKKIEARQEDVRTNLFLGVARWAAQKSIEGGQHEGKAWMPHPIVPVIDPNCRESFDLSITLANPKGSIQLLALHADIDTNSYREEVSTMDLFFRSTMIIRNNPEESLLSAISIFEYDFFHPNIVILSKQEQHYLPSVTEKAFEAGLGVIYHSRQPAPQPLLPFINVWIRPQSPDWSVSIAQVEGNLDLALLLAIRLASSHNLQIRLVTTLQSDREMETAEEYLEGIVDLGRLPVNTIAIAFLGDIWDCIHQAPSAEIHIFGLPNNSDGSFLKKVEEQTFGHRIFVQGSGKENLLA